MTSGIHQLTIGDIEILVDKVGGVENALSIIKGDVQVQTVEVLAPFDTIESGAFSTREIQVGTHKREYLLATLLSSRDFDTHEHVEEMINQSHFEVSSTRRTVTLVVPTVEALGFKVPTPPSEIFQRAKDLELKRCSIEEALQLRLEYWNQAPGTGQRMIVAMKPLKGPNGKMSVFTVEREHNGLPLLGVQACTSYEKFDLSSRFVFVRP